MDDRVSGVTGHVKHAETRSMADSFIDELSTVHAARHHHVGEQKIDLMASV